MSNTNTFFVRYSPLGASLALSMFAMAFAVFPRPSTGSMQIPESVQTAATDICRTAVGTHLGRAIPAGPPADQFRNLPELGLEVRGTVDSTGPHGDPVQTSYVCTLHKEADALSLMKLEITDHSL